jgi:hypothetical protein
MVGVVMGDTAGIEVPGLHLPLVQLLEQWLPMHITDPEQ